MPRRKSTRFRRLPGDRFRAGKRIWSRAEDALLRREYSHTGTAALARRLRRTASAVYARADKLGLYKSPDFKRRVLRRLGKGLQELGASHRYEKGHVPANKGLRRPGWAPGRMSETQFKKGELAGAAQRKWRPVGTETVDADGYRKRKVSDDRTIPSRFNWRFVHVLVWEQHHGPVPPGHAVIFRNGNKADIRIENLELVTRQGLMARNTVHNLPKPLAELVQLKGALQRQINKRSQG